MVAPSFADIFYVNCTKNGLLPGDPDEEHCRELAAAGEARIDVDDQTVTFAGGVVEFEIDEEIKHRLLHGLDDIGITLQDEGAITAFEAGGGADRGPVTTGAVSRADPRDFRAPSLASGTPRRTTASPTSQEDWSRAVIDRLDLRGRRDRRSTPAAGAAG